MLISKAMNTNSLTLNRFRSEVESHFGLALALRAASKQTVCSYCPDFLPASLTLFIASISPRHHFGECR